MQFIDLIGYIAAGCTTFAFLPQAIKTLRNRDTQSLSLGMYVIFTVGVLLWGIYGWMRHDWTLVMANACTGLFSLAILIIKIRNDVFPAQADRAIVAVNE